jgi:hypothetical protein
MHPNTFRAALLASAFTILISPARAVTYTATLLHPSDFLTTSGTGVSNVSQVGQGSFSGGSHALLWTGSASSVVDLNGTYTATYAAAATDTQQFGDGYGPSTSARFHALLWSGTAGSVVDLNPTGFDVSYARGIDGTHQVGYAFSESDFLSRAIVWNSSATDFTNLHPDGFNESFANAVSGDRQVGYGVDSFTLNHALLWSGTAASSIDLTPPNFTDSVANGVYTSSPNTSLQIGSGSGFDPLATNGETHALLWSGSATNVVDLHPAGYSFSEGIAISAAGQVGDGYGDSTSGGYHALYWNGTAASAFDLHPSLSTLGHEFIASSAYAIAPNGNIVGTAIDSDFNTYAILWTPSSSESGVAADYNNDGKVDAADYIAWRKGSTPLHNEVATIGSNTPADYTEWRARFGNPPGSGASLTGASVPEPSSCTLLIAALATVRCCRAKRRK